jgi:two-component system sensor histidine kinase KdpD
MDDYRPDPDELLAQIQADEAKRQRGKLKIFFGAAAGVGKTYTMLDAAHLRKEEGVDVVVGYVEPHPRPETLALLEGLAAIPPRLSEYKGTQLREFDLDAALARKPSLILVDELAHSNAPGSRHPKRWQDVEELLAAGINVYTTVNVQHIESLRDVVAQITGIVQHETVPDAIIESADEVEYIDLAPEDLIKRLREGKIYPTAQVESALRSFFRTGNLLALRELALRNTAARVDEQMKEYRRDHDIQQTWPAGETLLVCVSPSPLAPRLVRATKRMASSLHADWIAVYVETPRPLKPADRLRITETLRLAEQLGAQTVTLHGAQVGDEVLRYAHEHNISRVIVGKPTHPRWRDLLFGSFLDDLMRKSGDIDIYVITGEPEQQRAFIPQMPRRTSGWSAYGQATLIVLLCTAIAALMFPLFAAVNLVMVYLVGIVFAASRYGRGPSVLASILSVATFDFFFVQPHFTFAVSDTQYIFTFAIMLLVALTISTLTVQIKQQAEHAREREQRTASLYALSRDLANTRESEMLIQLATKHMAEVFDSRVTVLLPNVNGVLMVNAADTESPVAEEAVARWVFDHRRLAGLNTDTLPGSKGLYLPLTASQDAIGVLAMFPRDAKRFTVSEQLHLLETFANQTALALERTRLAQAAAQAQIRLETERTRNTLLSSVSHDLRTPLAVITGATSSLLQREKSLSDADRRELAQVAYEESERLNRFVGNLLDMTRLESGSIQVHRDWQLIEEVIGAALNRVHRETTAHPVHTAIPPNFPLVQFDEGLIEQVLINLLENALKYTPLDSPIDISAYVGKEEVILEVADRGPGIEPGDEERIFEKFYRSQPTRSKGVGLGLAICRGIVQAHGGRIWAENRPDGGAVFRFTLPLTGEQPSVIEEEYDTNL